jgi:hypothetical protein
LHGSFSFYFSAVTMELGGAKVKPKGPQFASRKQIAQRLVGQYRSDNDDTRYVHVKGDKSPGDFNAYENNLVNSLDCWRDIQKMTKLLTQMDKGEIDLQSFFQGFSTEAAKTLILTAISGENEKNQLEAAKHLLALSGHAPSQKLQVERIDPDTPKQALISMLMGSRDALADEGIIIEDDSTAQDQPE